MDEKRTVFRMRSINDNTLKAFFNDEVYASSPLYFNDPYDVLACYDNEKLYELFYTDAEGRNFLINKTNEFVNASGYGYFDDETVEKWCKDKEKLYPFINPVINDISLATMQQLREQLTVACFCNDVKKGTMWTHYAGNGTGFALEYDFDEVNAAIQSYVRENFESYKGNSIFKNCSFKLEDVKYTNKKANITKIIFKINKTCFSKGYKHFLTQQKFEQIVFTKRKEWQYESEVRLALPTKKTPFEKLEGIKPKAIYLGEFISKEYQYILCNAAKEKKIMVYQMYSKLEDGDYGLHCKVISANEIDDLIKKYKDIERYSEL